MKRNQTTLVLVISLHLYILPQGTISSHIAFFSGKISVKRIREYETKKITCI